MENLSLNLKELSSIVIKIIEKIQSLDSNTFSKNEKMHCTKEMLEEINNCHQFFLKALSHDTIDDKSKILIEKINEVFNIFNKNTNVECICTPYDFEKYLKNGRILISNILKLLGAKGCGILIIETYLKLCLKLVMEMTENVEASSSIDVFSFKILLESISVTANIFNKYWKKAIFKQTTYVILCLSQIYKCLPILLKAVEMENYDIQKFSLKLLTQFLTKILDEIHFNDNQKQYTHGKEFIKLMDFCLYKLSNITHNNCDYANLKDIACETYQALKPIIDEILCHSISIAQVTHVKKDYEAILIYSQKVLKELNDWNNDIKNGDVYQIKLCASGIADVLCSLEQIVNTAVLKLVLDVFSGTNSALKSLISKCKDDIGKNNKTPEDLKILISDFDSEMDKIMQIGLFAIACSSDVKRIHGIQSCLASLESLETELISSLTILYMDCSFRNKTNFQILIDFWLNEITELKTHIDSVLDPAAFCEVVNIQIKKMVMGMKDDIVNGSIDKSEIKSILKQIIKYSRKLIKSLKTFMEDEKEPLQETYEYLRQFQLSVQECEAIFELIDSEDDNISKKALKRCNFLLGNLGKLNCHFFELVSNDLTCNKSDISHGTSTELDIKASNEDYYKLNNTDCLFRTLPEECDVELLTPYINKGIMLSKKRNILCTPFNYAEKNLENEINSTLQKSEYWNKTPVSRRSRCCRTLNLNLELGHTLDLEITTILENLSELSTTLSKNLHRKECNEPENFEKVEKKINVSCEVSKTPNTGISKYTSSGCCTNSAFLNKESLRENYDKNNIGSTLRTKFLKSLHELSENTSLLICNDNEDNFELDTAERVKDFLKS